MMIVPSVSALTRFGPQSFATITIGGSAKR